MYITTCKIHDQGEFRCVKQDTQSLCSGTTQRDGGVFRIGETHVYLWLIHADV